MKSVNIAEICYTKLDFEVLEIFPENWIKRKEFSLYKHSPRPCDALFFVCTDIEVSFFPTNAPKITAKKGDVVFLPRDSLYFVGVTGSTDAKIDTYTVNFHTLDPYHRPTSLLHNITVVTNRQDNLLEVHLKNLNDTFHRVEEHKSSAKRNIIKTKGEFLLLLDAVASSASQNDDFYYPIRKGIDMFCDEWNLNEKIEKYAELCGVSVTYFFRCFKKWSGSSPVEYRNTLRLSNAESLLRCTDMQIKDIAQTVGFDDPFYFCRIFSQRFGISPQKYRKRSQNVGE